ncbi:olfactory receptor 52P1-like [Carettochelys insculpta]|uniref:olfactory receptor 52P1-like n=1 Tax=Carettochelys insculpta TaxID=44489 RepID=UPI003EC106D8
MSAANLTPSIPDTFLLLGIPGLEAAHLWISVPVCTMYVVIIVGNCTLLLVIATEPALHRPMCYFLCMLAAIDLGSSACIQPKLLCIFWFQAREINAGACLAQLFFIHSISMTWSGVLLAMALDRYVAICAPLQYNSVFTSRLVAKLCMAALARGMLLMSPCPFLIKRLSFCRGNVIPHTYCEHMAVVNLACGNTIVNQVYGLSAALFVIGGDLLFIGLSYCLIVRAVLRLSSREARIKAFGTCSSHICVILISYTPALFSFFTHRFGHHVSPHIHVILANLYFMLPPLLHPIVYGVRIKAIREGVVRVILRGTVSS